MHDVFGSEARRRAQAAKDAVDVARPVVYVKGLLALRPIAERLAAATPPSRSEEELAERRAHRRHNRQRARRRRFHRPVSSKNRARAAA